MLNQFTAAPVPVILLVLAIIAASMMPSNAGASGPFTRSAELINGRTAMVGFVALVITELLKGGPYIPA